MSEKTKQPERDWTEDFGHENGNYQCICGDCGETFIGHKRRVTCKKCASPQPVEGDLREQIRIAAAKVLQIGYRYASTDKRSITTAEIDFATDLIMKYSRSLPTVKTGKTLEECKDEVAKSKYKRPWYDLPIDLMYHSFDEVSELYAKQTNLKNTQV